MGEWSNGRTKCPSQSKIGEFEATISSNEKILRFQISVHDSTSMAKGKTTTALEEVGFDEHWVKESGARLHVLFEVLVEEFKDEVKFSIFLDTVLEFHDIFMAEFPQETDFTKSSRRDSLVFDFEADALERNDFPGNTVSNAVSDRHTWRRERDLLHTRTYRSLALYTTPYVPSPILSSF